jgi:type II secretion system protein H
MAAKAITRISAIGNMRRAASHSSGFTLVELMVVLVLISIFTGLIVGEMRGTYEDALLRSSARKLVSAFNLASSRAVTLGQPLIVSIDPVHSRFAIRRAGAMPGENGAPSGLPGLIEEGKLDERIAVQPREAPPAPPAEGEENSAPEEMAESSGGGEAPPKLGDIQFNADGTADAREILLRDRMGVELLIQINPITGRVKIASPKAKPEARP